MSGQKDREKRREERIAAESKAAGADRRTRLLQLSAGGVFLAIIVVVVIIVVASSNSSSSSGGDSKKIVEVPQVEKLLTGIPQNKNSLGKANAPVTMFEYGDLQCPVCKEYSEEFLPKLIENQVKSGQMRIVYRDFIIIGPESVPAGEAALAAGEQGKGWSFIELFYRNQGEERSGYVTDAFIESVAKSAGVKNMAQFNKERKSGKFKKQVEETTAQANKFGFGGTPSFAIEGPGSEGIELLSTPQTEGQFEAAIKKAS